MTRTPLLALAMLGLLAACGEPVSPVGQAPAAALLDSEVSEASVERNEQGYLEEVYHLPPEPPRSEPLRASTLAMYTSTQDGDVTVPAVPEHLLSEAKKRKEVPYYAPYKAGTIVVDPGARKLYHLLGDDRAMSYTVAVGAAGKAFSGEAKIAFKREWPTWTPTQNMIRREPEVYKQFAGGMDGGLDNPLGARALYLYRNGKDTLYRIHGTRSPASIGHAVSSGCIRLFNQDIIDLAAQVENGTRVVVLNESQSGRYTTSPATMVSEADISDAG
ncbi:L,D-transpeptidase [Sagittula salina]|uniref:L,D-transpeptidase n=1 Tax=Sagittula salina TaxID=2820268 RepID=A0A940MQ20_9RHOB|nr:L,D-transpeptidase [Sagittula salina]MBP0482022.1 L,D-transpeptidase [Sagittula salina]